jgi:hypothetical protein
MRPWTGQANNEEWYPNSGAGVVIAQSVHDPQRLLEER